MRYIGIHKTGNYGTVWVKGTDGLYRSVEDEYVSRAVRALTQEDMEHDLEGGFIAELTDENISTLGKRLGRNPTTIELADHMKRIMSFPLTPDEVSPIEKAAEEGQTPKQLLQIKTPN